MTGPKIICKALLLSTALTGSALAGGYVSPYVEYNPPPVVADAPAKFSWTGPYVGAHIGHTKLDLKRKVETEVPEEYIDHDAITKIVKIPHEAVTAEVATPEEKTIILHPAETETTLVPPVIEKKDITITTQGGEIEVPKYIPHPAEYGKEKITIGKLIATKDADLPDGYTLDVPAGGDNPDYFYVKKGNGDWAYGEADKPGYKLSTYQPTYEAEKTVITKPAYVEETTETVTVPPGSFTYTETYIKEPARIDTKTIKDAWEEEKITKPAGTETVVVKPGYVEEKEVVVKPAWREVIKAAYTSTFMQELKDNANSFGVFGGYRYQFQNNVVLGVEGSYTKANNISATFERDTHKFDLSTVSIEAQAGYALGKFLPYVAAGYANAGGDGGWLAAAGVDYALTDRVIIGARYTHHDFNDLQGWEADTDTVSLRVGFKF